MPSLSTNLAILGGSGLAGVLADGIPDKTTRQTLKITAGIAGFIAALDIGLTAARFIREGNREFWDAVKEAASLPYGSGSLTEQGIGLFGRFVGAEPEAGVGTSPDRGAEEGPYLGTPRNALRVAGVIRTIENQVINSSKIIQVPAFSDTVLIDAAVENQSNAVQSGTINFRALMRDASQTVPGPTVNLAPGELRQISARIPRSLSYLQQFDIALQFRSYTLDRVTFVTL